MSSRAHHTRKDPLKRGAPFVLSKHKRKIYLTNAVFPEGGHDAPCYILIYRRSKYAQGGPLRFWVTVDGRKLAKPLENNTEYLIGVKPGKHVVDLKMPKTGLVKLNRNLETSKLEAGEMHFFEMAICGLTIPYTKVWDLGRMRCPIAKVEEKPQTREETVTTTTTTTQLPPQYTMLMGPPPFFTMTPPPTGFPMFYGVPQSFMGDPRNSIGPLSPPPPTFNPFLNGQAPYPQGGMPPMYAPMTGGAPMGGSPMMMMGGPPSGGSPMMMMGGAPMGGSPMMMMGGPPSTGGAPMMMGGGGSPMGIGSPAHTPPLQHIPQGTPQQPTLQQSDSYNPFAFTSS